jgi:hypothetical protein
MGQGDVQRYQDLCIRGTQMVTPQYFHTLGVMLVSGCFFEERDREDASNVAIVNEAFARKFPPNEDPVGREVTVWFAKTIILVGRAPIFCQSHPK